MSDLLAELKQTNELLRQLAKTTAVQQEKTANTLKFTENMLLKMLLDKESIAQHAHKTAMMALRNLLHDGVFTFYHRDIPVSLFLPTVPHDLIENAIIETGTFFEAPLLERACRHIRPETIVLDIGANIGNHSVFFAKICGACEVLAFEPQGRACEIFRKNMALNNIANYTLFQMAAGRNNGTVSSPEYDAYNRGATRFVPDANGETQSVRLDDLDLPAVGFMKIDVEGFEMDVLEGGKKRIVKDRPVIWVELLNENARKACFPLLESWGYPPPVELGSTDFLFCPGGPEDAS